MRLLVVGVRYPPHHTGGYELHCASVVEHARAAGHEVTVLTSTLRVAGVAADDDPRVGRELVSFDPGGSWPGLRAAGRAERHNVAALRRALAKVRPDVVCWWRMGELSLSLVEHVRRAGIPAVGVVCDQWLLEAPARDPWQRLPRAARPLQRWLGLPAPVDWDAAAEWLFVSDWLRTRTLSAGPRLRRTGVAPAGLRLARLPRRPQAPPWRGRLLHAGRLTPLKGGDDAIAALAHLPQDTTLDLVGHGSDLDRERLRAVARQAGVARRVRLAGPVAPEAMAAVYAEHDALLFCSRWQEPWGLVPLEAMAVGLPVVATGTGGSREYLRAGENALLVETGAPAAVAAAVARLAAEPQLRARLAGAGRATAERFPAEACDARVLARLASAGAPH